MFCHKCGKELLDSAKYCRYCGTDVDIETEKNEMTGVTEGESPKAFPKENILDDGIIANFFSINGRIDGWCYLKRKLALYLGLILVSILIVALGNVFKEISPAFEFFSLVCLVLIIILYYISNITLVVRRFHDLGISGWFASILYIALIISSIIDIRALTIDFLITLILLLIKGTAGTNKYGRDPLEHILSDDIKNFSQKNFLGRISYIILVIFLMVIVLFSFWDIESKNQPFYQTNKNIQIKDNTAKSQTNLQKKEHPGIFKQLGSENGISVNIGNGNFLKANIILELNPNKKDVIDEGVVLSSAETKMQNIVLNILKTTNDYEFNATKQDILKQKIKREINSNLGDDTVFDVYITSYVIE